MSVRVTTLGNGLRVVTDEMATVETASVGAWVAVGTRHEALELNGISHLLEHMAFKGTRRRSAQAIVEEIENVGGHLNAYTGRENTAYFAKVLKDDLPLAVDIIADIVQNSTLDEDELTRERAVIIQEIHQAQDTPDDIIFDHFQAAAFPEQPMGRPVLGSAELIAGIERQTLLEYMGDEYTAERIVLAAAGKVDHDAFAELVEAAFDGLSQTRRGDAQPLDYRGGEYRENRELEQVHLVIGFEGLRHDHPDHYALSVFSTLFGGGMSSRLFQEARERRGLVYSIYSFSASYEDGGLFGIYAGTGRTEAAELVPLICSELARACKVVGEDEVARARAQLKANTLMGLESTSSRCEQAARQLQIFGRPIPVDETIAKIEAVGAEDVLRAAGRVAASRPTFATIGPGGGIEPLENIVGHLGNG
ncbi:MAG: pitrilysin family protein [Rhodospirillales bacterium]|jgi:predicted Zn-dependent peptidase|nr:peptidase M16 [Rhodospirillaceae bacterium]MDP6430043.1 pitrilysin family protein [Rhodospirillales bacterium]MDP6642718.1 pitrilysin family protein [Rhodospirillales bacterium]MDP6841666.1 pitrilysin family protein [Rhodospirillales bacterium]